MSCYSRAKLNLVRHDFSTAFETGLRNVPRYKTRVQSITIHIFFCSFTLLFGDVLDRWCLIFAAVLLKPPLNFLRTMLVLQCCIRLFCFHSLVISTIHRKLCSACLNHLLKTQVLGNVEETLVSLFGVYFAMKKTKRKRRLISSVSRRFSFCTWEFLAGLSALNYGVATNSGWRGCHRTRNREMKERIAVHATD